MPPDTTTITATALLMGLGVAPMTGCFVGGDDVESSSEMSGADYGGPDAGDWSSDEVVDSESTDTAETESTSSSESTTETETTSTTEEDTSTDTTTTGGAGFCGWDPGNMYYECGFEGVDLGGLPIECPMGLVDGDPCVNTGLTAAGCCDANGDNWYCAQGDVVFFADCP